MSTGTRSQRGQLAWRGLLLAAGFACAASPRRSHAQPAAGTIAGVVRDSLGAGIAGAEVTIDGAAGPTSTTDDRGAFRATAVPPGLATLRVRRLGFRPQAVEVRVAEGREAQVELRLVALSQRLAPVVVQARRVKYTGPLAGYYQRLERGTSGHFITRQDFERENPRFLTQILQRVPGLQATRGRGGTRIRMRGRACSPLVWIDGSPAAAGEIDLDSFAPSSLEGVELYLGATNAPNSYQWLRGGSNCGTILLWSRHADQELARGRATLTPEELGALVGAAAVFTAEQVDNPARLLAPGELAVEYPQSLRASRVRGRVVAEFVVDTVGQVDRGTVGIVSSTHPLFSQVVQDALSQARFDPATRQGRRVPQLVQQPFDFAPPARGRR